MKSKKHRLLLKLFVRSFHTILCILIPYSLLSQNSSDLYTSVYDEKKKSAWYPALYFTFLIGAIITYHITCFLDPGYVPLNTQLPSSPSLSLSDDESQIDIDIDLEEGNEETSNSDSSKLLKRKRKKDLRKKCGFCDIKQPLRAKHCHDCDRCVRRFDHHCPWLETCIAEKTHRFFLIFLYLMSISIIWSAHIAWRALVYKSTWSAWFHINWILLLDLLVLLIGAFTTIILCMFHTHLMCINATTWEVVSRERIGYLKHLDMEINPFHEGYCKNIFVFLCSRAPNNWDKIYLRRSASNNSDSSMETV